MNHIIMTTDDWEIIVGIIGFEILVCYALWLLYPRKKVSWLQDYLQNPNQKVFTDKQNRHMKWMIWGFGILLTFLLGLTIFQFVTSRLTPARIAHNQRIERKIKPVDSEIADVKQQLEFDKIMQHKTTDPKQLQAYLDQQFKHQTQLKTLLKQRSKLNHQIYRPNEED